MRVTDLNSFIEKSNIVHNFKYDYSKSVYKKSGEKVEIVCHKHGSFYQEARLHVSGKGCPSCPKNAKKDKDYFAERSRLVHGDRYDYSKSIYFDRNKALEIFCRIHGGFFQSPYNHYAGKGCPKCGAIVAVEKKKKTFTQFVSEAQLIHGERYLYIENTYNSAREKMDISCSIHGIFQQTPNKHLAGQGCRKCSDESRETIWSYSNYKEKCEDVSNGKSKVYLIECYGISESFYKIGVSLHGAIHRFNSRKKMPYKFNLISEIELDAEKIMRIESELHKKLKNNKYKPSLFFHGHTECFSSISSEVAEFFGVSL